MNRHTTLSGDTAATSGSWKLLTSESSAPWPSVVFLARQDFDHSGVELRPLTMTGLVKALGGHWLKMMRWRLARGLWRLGLLDTPEGARYRFSEDFRLDWWRVLAERRKRTTTISEEDFSPWSLIRATPGAFHLITEDELIPEAERRERSIYMRGCRATEEFLTRSMAEWATVMASPETARAIGADLVADWARAVGDPLVLPPSDRGIEGAVPLGSPEYTIPPPAEDWATQNKRICDLLAGRCPGHTEAAGG